MRRLLVLTSAVVFLDTLFFSAIAPLLPHYAHDLGLTKAAAGVLAGAYPAGTLLAAIPAIWVAKKVGVKGALLVGLFLLAASSVAFGLGDSVAVLDASRFLQGVSGALCWSGSLAWLVATAPVNRRGSLIGTAMGLSVAGSLLGPALGTAAEQFGDVLVCSLVAAAALGLAAWASTFPGNPEAASIPHRRTLLRGLRDRSVQAGGWLNALYGLGFGALSVLVPLRLSALGATAAVVGLAFALSAVGEMIASPLAGRLSDRGTRLSPVRAALPGAAIVLALLPIPDVAWIVAVLMILSGPRWARWPPPPAPCSPTPPPRSASARSSPWPWATSRGARGRWRARPAAARWLRPPPTPCPTRCCASPAPRPPWRCARARAPRAPPTRPTRAPARACAREPVPDSDGASARVLFEAYEVSHLAADDLPQRGERSPDFITGH